MSRSLPDFPNLDHLKKQAKAVLRELRQRNPAAKLAQAQHAIAREHGFGSWAKLKAHVESLAAPGRSRSSTGTAGRRRERAWPNFGHNRSSATARIRRCGRSFPALYGESSPDNLLRAILGAGNQADRSRAPAAGADSGRRGPDERSPWQSVIGRGPSQGNRAPYDGSRVNLNPRRRAAFE